ncbi:STAS domain-containing protein [Streptomyces syringium]|uniref:STAS domain-containing protein n=1 Tax=Streptomyces syringium TaxID=76729 RepID=UPI003415D6CC
MAGPHTARAGEEPPRHGVLDIRPCADRPGIAASGEISLTSQTEWEGALEGLLSRGGDAYLELSDVTFVDVAGTSALARAAQRLGPAGRRIVVHEPPPSLRRALEMFWSDLTVIEVTG